MPFGSVSSDAEPRWSVKWKTRRSVVSGKVGMTAPEAAEPLHSYAATERAVGAIAPENAPPLPVSGFVAPEFVTDGSVAPEAVLPDSVVGAVGSVDPVDVAQELVVHAPVSALPDPDNAPVAVPPFDVPLGEDVEGTGPVLTVCLVAMRSPAK